MDQLRTPPLATPDSTQHVPGILLSTNMQQRVEHASGLCGADELTQYETLVNTISRNRPENQSPLLHDLTTIIGLTDTTNATDRTKAFARRMVRGELLTLMTQGLSNGSRAMNHFSSPVVERGASAVGKDSPLSYSEFARYRDFAGLFDADVHTAFENTFLRALPVFATLLGRKETQHLIFEGSKRYRRTLGYRGAHMLDDALRALRISTASIERLSQTGAAIGIEEVNPGFGTASAYNYVLEDPSQKDQPTKVYIREQEGKRILGEYGNDDVQASVSFMVPLDSMARKQPRGESPIDHTEVPTYERQNKYAVLKAIKHAIEESQQNMVSIRLDFEGNIRNGARGLSLDLGSILSDTRGLSFVVGNLFATGDILLAKRAHREAMYNHNAADFHQDTFGNEISFLFIADAIRWRLTRDKVLPVRTLREQFYAPAASSTAA